MLFIFEYVDVLMYVPIVYGFLPEINRIRIRNSLAQSVTL